MNGKCTALGVVRHYSMTAQQYANNAARKTIQTQESQRDPKTGLFTLSVNYGNATCGTTNPKTGACMDYSYMHAFMKKQIRKAANGTAVPEGHMCPRNLTWGLGPDNPTYEELLSQTMRLSKDDKITASRIAEAAATVDPQPPAPSTTAASYSRSG